ncbi:MAG: D-alanine--D-alanine ligase [Burkholderiales bacterium]|nr:D-alanine--D-alanine ligase [Burkholderiales bacterium]
MSTRIKVAILFGGKSAEHEVSLQSAKNVIHAIDKVKYEVVPIGIDRDGTWRAYHSSKFLVNEDHPGEISINQNDGECVALVPYGGGDLISLSSHSKYDRVDVIFPLLHGPYGEDGTMQGLLKLSNVPFVGSGVLGSSVGMDKDFTKRLLRDAGLPIGDFVTVRRGEAVDLDEVLSALGSPVFVKPANLGSSVGISKAQNTLELQSAIELALRYDKKILIEAFIAGREVECGVLGNDHPAASVVGEITPHHDFYSYEAKYLDQAGASSKVPAAIPPEISTLIRNLSIKVFKTLGCEGLARVDFFLKKDGTVLVNEINTIPGFTNISMYPALWRESGVGYTDLISQLIELAFKRFEQDHFLNT